MNVVTVLTGLQQVS